MAVPNAARIKLAQEIQMPDGVTAMNIYYFVCDFQADQAEEDVVDACEAWIEFLFTPLAGEISDECTLGTMTVYHYNAITDQWDNIGEGTPTKAFTNTNEMLPHGVSMLVRAYTTNPRTIGRKYIPGYTEEDSVDGAWTAAAITNATTWAGRWGTSGDIDVNNKLMPGVYSEANFFVYELTDVFVVLADPAYQRRRRPGVGV